MWDNELQPAWSTRTRRVFNASATGTAKARTARASVYETEQCFGLLLTRWPAAQHWLSACLRTCTVHTASWLHVNITHGLTWIPSKNWTQQFGKAITCVDGILLCRFCVLLAPAAHLSWVEGGGYYNFNHRCHHAQCLTCLFSPILFTECTDICI